MNNHIAKTTENTFALQINDEQFGTAPTVTESIWKKAICRWWSARHHCDIAPEALVFLQGSAFSANGLPVVFTKY